MPLGVEVGLGPGHIWLDGDAAPPPPNAAHPQLLACVCSGLTAGWIKMPLGTEIGLSLGDVVWDKDPAPLP